MFDWLTKLFTAPKYETKMDWDMWASYKPIEPKIGEKWVLGLWITERVTVTILDVKDGWVKYYINEIFDDEQMTIQAFVHLYGKVQ
jgi:hypothetical protein